MSKNQAAGINGLVEYKQLDWGDLIYATKEYLQAIGLGLGLAFPGEPGGPKRTLRTRDPRGHSVEIEECLYIDGCPYFARITFLNWPQHPRDDRQQFEAYRGVMCSHSISWFDEYIGPEDALVAAGLVREDQLPGKPGMRKVRVTILPDGSPLGGPPTANPPPAARAPGARWIERAGRSRYRVCVRVPEDEEARRRAAQDTAEEKWRYAVLSMNRPAKLMPASQLPPATTTAQPAQQYRPLFGDAPTAPGEKEEYRKNVFESLKELVDFQQTSAY
ncbi:MAG TPA: hypothetical protein VN617_11795 [Rhodoferax sp.]|nr:hypothetical protein [Rhodoferax sp.]